jgi:hypothetical protein
MRSVTPFPKRQTLTIEEPLIFVNENGASTMFQITRRA